jgi:hypothetical protein
MKSHLFLLFVSLFVISIASNAHRSKHKSIHVPDLMASPSNQQIQNPVIDPLSIHIALGQTQTQRTGKLILI